MIGKLLLNMNPQKRYTNKRLRREDSIANNTSNESEAQNREGSSGQSTASLNEQENPNSRPQGEANSTLGNESSNAQGLADSNENNDDNRNEANIFDRFMDSILSYRNRVQSPMPGASEGTASLATTGISEAGQEAGPATDVGQTSGATPAEGNGLTTSTDSNGGAIVITVNYVFSDENNPQNPNRSGSLVMTLPNNSSNRDPRIIQEFIRLATLMAYSTIVNLNKEKGITIDKFNSFDIKTLEELKDTSKECSICFEDYIAYSDKNCAKKRSITEEIKSDDVLVKKRKLNNSEAESVAASSSTSATSPNSTTGEANSSRPKYLSEFTGTFEHLPVQMPCGHVFGKSCLFEWLKSHSSCPLCRDSVSETNTNEAASTEGNNENPNSNITFIHRPGIMDIFNSLPRSGEGDQPVRRILRSGNGLGEGNPHQAHTHTHFIPTAGENSNEDPSTNQRGVFSHLLNYLRRSQLGENSEPLFPTGVSSIRNAHGVETRLTDRNDSDDNVLEFMNLRSLVDENSSHTNNDPSNGANNANTNADDNINNTNDTNNNNNNDDENAAE